MATLRSIKKRIGVVKNIRKITRAMKMISAAKLRRSVTALENFRQYHRAMEGIYDHLMKETLASSHNTDSVVRSNSSARIILFTSNRGLCGGFNTSLVRHAQKVMQSYDQVEFHTIGKTGTNSIQKLGVSILSRRPQNFKLSLEDVETWGDQLLSDHRDKKFDRLVVVYSEFVNAVSQRPTHVELLPIPWASLELPPYLYEPNGKDVVNGLIRRRLASRIYLANLESIASEHGSRMRAMDAATTNSEEMISNLTLIFNSVRQATITKAMLEIINGAEALGKA